MVQRQETGREGDLEDNNSSSIKSGKDNATVMALQESVPWFDIEMKFTSKKEVDDPNEVNGQR